MNKSVNKREDLMTKWFKTEISNYRLLMTTFILHIC